MSIEVGFASAFLHYDNVYSDHLLQNAGDTNPTSGHCSTIRGSENRSSAAFETSLHALNFDRVRGADTTFETNFKTALVKLP